MAKAPAPDLYETLARPILDVIGALVVVLDVEGRILRINRACERLTGFDNDEVVGHPVWERLVPTDEVDDVKAVFKALQSGEPQSSHSNGWMTKTGERRVIDWSNLAVRDDTGAIQMVIGTGIDVTDRVETERELSTREAELSAVLKTAIDAIVMIDENGIVQDANPATEAMFGYSAAELIGANVSLLMPEPERSAHDDYLRRYLQGGKPKIIGVGRDVIGQRKDGSLVPVNLSVAEMQLPDRRLFTGLLHDLSDRRRIEALSNRLGRIVEAALNEGAGVFRR